MKTAPARQGQNSNIPYGLNEVLNEFDTILLGPGFLDDASQPPAAMRTATMLTSWAEIYSFFGVRH